MTRRVAVFAIVWAYTVNALWVPSGIDSGYWISVLFPAPYYFLLGGIVGWLYAAATRRWSRGLVTAALVLTLIEWARWLFAGQLPFMYLGLPFTLATSFADYVVRHPRFCLKDSRFSTGNQFAMWCVGLLVLYASLAPTTKYFLHAKAVVSPGGAYVARCIAGDDMIDDDNYYIYVGPGKMPLRWFGYSLRTGMYAPATNLHWVSPRTLIANSPDRYQSFQGQYCNALIDLQNHP